MFLALFPHVVCRGYDRLWIHSAAYLKCARVAHLPFLTLHGGIVVALTVLPDGCLASGSDDDSAARVGRTQRHDGVFARRSSRRSFRHIVSDALVLRW